MPKLVRCRRGRSVRPSCGLRCVSSGWTTTAFLGTASCGEQPVRAGHDVGRDQVARLMRAASIEGIRRGRPASGSIASRPLGR